METIGGRQITEVDYKADAGDILFALQEAYGNEVPALFTDRMKSLAENYTLEQIEDVLMAIGQEITLAHYLLFTIEEDSDSYVLALIPEAEEESFVQEMKTLKRKVKVLLQPRKKPGKEAKRIDLGKRLSYKVYEMPEKLRFTPQDPIDGLYVVDSLHFRDRNVESGLLALDPEPHVVYRIPKILECLTGKDSRYAAIWHNPERGEGGALLDRSTYIAVGTDLANVSEWKVIHRDDERSWEVCCWYGDHLFLADKNKVAVIKNAMNGGNAPEIILESKEHRLTFPKLFQVNGQLYLYLQGIIYCWQNAKLLRKEGFTKKVYSIKTETIGGIVPVGNGEVAFIEENYGVPRSREIRMTEVTLLNVETGAVRKVPCPVGNLASVEAGKLLVLCTGHDMVKNKKQLPIMISIDVRSGEQQELPFGSMGNLELSDVYKTSEGHLVFRVFGDDRVYYPENVCMV